MNEPAEIKQGEKRNRNETLQKWRWDGISDTDSEAVPGGGGGGRIRFREPGRVPIRPLTPASSYTGGSDSRRTRAARASTEVGRWNPGRQVAAARGATPEAPLPRGGLCLGRARSRRGEQGLEGFAVGERVGGRPRSVRRNAGLARPAPGDRFGRRLRIKTCSIRIAAPGAACSVSCEAGEHQHRTPMALLHIF